MVHAVHFKTNNLLDRPIYIFSLIDEFKSEDGRMS